MYLLLLQWHDTYKKHPTKQHHKTLIKLIPWGASGVGHETSLTTDDKFNIFCHFEDELRLTGWKICSAESWIYWNRDLTEEKRCDRRMKKTAQGTP
jgi:hypothetical protein